MKFGKLVDCGPEKKLIKFWKVKVRVRVSPLWQICALPSGV